MWASYMHHPKCEIAGLGSLKGVLEAFCKLKSINLRTDTIKMLGVPFSYNDTLKVQNVTTLKMVCLNGLIMVICPQKLQLYNDLGFKNFMMKTLMNRK